MINADKRRFSAGYFCLKTPSLTEIASSTTLAEYAQRQVEAVKKGEGDKDSSLSVFWSSYMSNNAKVPNDAKDPSVCALSSHTAKTLCLCYSVW